MKEKMRALFLSLLLAFSLAGCAVPPPEEQPNPSPLSDQLIVHFIDVGQADAALVQCGGQNMLIDGGNVEDSSLVVSYLEKQGVETLDYVVCSHAHEDHVGGLSGPLNAFDVNQVFSPVADYDSKAFRDFVKYTKAQGLTPECPAPDATYPLGEAEVTILGPRKEYEKTNNTSIVLRVDFGETSFLFTGDMEREAEADLVEAGCDLSASVLKAGHHGSDTSSTYSFLREVMPDSVVVSCGTGNSYGHPHKEPMSRFYDAGAEVYRTDLLGTVVAVSDGVHVTFSTEKQGTPIPGREAPMLERVYIGNGKSQVFHTDTCASLPAEGNRVYFDSREEAVKKGFRPCGSCKP